MSSKFEGPGGSPGGLGEFLIGFALAAAGGYLLSQQVVVTSGYWHLWGRNAFGLTLIPLLLGVAVLFFNGRSKVGWLLLIAGAVFLLAGILMNLEIYFRATSLFNTLTMLVLLFGGLGLLARSFRSHRP